MKMQKEDDILNESVKYKAFIIGADDIQKEEFKNSKCALLISVGQKYHEEGKLYAAIKLVNKNFSFCNIIVGDTLQRHNLRINHQDKSEDELYNLAEVAGGEWIERNMKYISTLTIPYTISRWDDWIKKDEYDYYHKEIYKFYNNDPFYKNTVNQIAHEYLLRRNYFNVKDKKFAFDICIKYLLEESAVACLWVKDGYNFDLYPSGANLSMIMAYNKFVIKKTDLKAKSLKFKIERSNSSPINELKAEEYKHIATNYILTHAPGHIYWKNLDGVFLGCNVEHAKYFGFDNPMDIIGKTNAELLGEENAADVSDADKKVMTTGQEHIIEECDGTKYFLSKKVPLRDYNNNIIGLLGTSINITEQKELEINLEKTVLELAQALESKENFIKNINHEIRIPMQLILSGSQILKDNFYKFNDSEKLYFLDGMIKATKRLNDLVSNLLDMSRFKEGKFTLNLKVEDFKVLFEEVVQEFSLMCSNKIECNIFLDFAHAICDKIRIQQVLRNLLSNSVKYSKESASISITLSNYDENEIKYIKCTLKDEGVGIPSAEKDAIFEPFRISSITYDVPGGVGLGLAISKEIIQSHNGKIWIDDLEENEVGTRISFILPLE